jgi:hypothetical protein
MVAPRAAETHVRLQVDDRASDLAYRWSMPADEPRRATAGLTMERS